ncbi:major facilitator super transporter protein [Knufia fluminis]|uniref:GPI ethanolamine phosphate transferase 2 n=1 Tax=Knufia fluminis TaxID=191047 RepID=A0AAN8EFE1_9EURO|nr:major facilitator super transporter protein [Knufia fluminis]
MRPVTVRKNTGLVLSNLVLGIAVLLFAKGFFPHKAVLPGLAAWPADIAAHDSAPFDKVIFMVVDALRSDFVYSNASSFHFTQSLIRSGEAIPFTGHASPPTITMPRVKAITTGSVPSFLDLVLNFAESDTSSSLAAQDSWLAQLKAKPNGKLVMYGDDTWLRLFPDFFDRADGTTSFFVSDFIEVDNNVTRHIPEELARDDWNGMVMHFLGLDHIGHKTGPRGPNMPAKQSEMDDIVQQIYQAMSTYDHLQSTLLVLLGDHGMNEAGNHGANSAGEVSTALTFISPLFKNEFEGTASPADFSEDFKYYDLVDQSDVAPTLAALLGFPIPKNSLGAIVPNMLQMWTNKADRFELLYRNAEQMQEVAYATYPEAFDAIPDLTACGNKDNLPDAQRLACKWLAVKDLHESFTSNQYMFIRDGSPLLRSFLKEAQSQLSGTASKYDLRSMLLGAGLLVVAIMVTATLGLTGATADNFALSTFCFTVGTYAATMFASSYVEEEHQFWYWISSGFLVLLTIKQQRVHMQGLGRFRTASGVVVCILFAIMRRWNQTGQKYAGEADLVTEVLTRSPWLLWTLIFLTYSIVPRRLRTRPAELGLKRMSIVPVLVTASAFLFKVAFTAAEAPELLKDMVILKPVVSFAARYPLMSLARIVFLGLGNLVGAALYMEKPWTSQLQMSSFLESLHDIMSLFLITQTRTVNIPLFLLFHFQVKVLQNYSAFDPFERLMTMLYMQYSSFFAFGGTNAISSVDLSNAYNGVGGYNVLAVGILTFVSNWAGPIWWTSATACVLKPRTGAQGKDFKYFGMLTLFAMIHALMVMVACLVLREHLFIWTVFSPKYLYMMAWTFAQHMVVNGIFSAVISVNG